jgi:hypothetical protein
MQTNAEILIWIAVVAIAIQLYVSARVVLASEYTLLQKLGQLAIVWLVPIVGALFVRAFLQSDRVPSRERHTSFIADGEGYPPGAAPPT